MITRWKIISTANLVSAKNQQPQDVFIYNIDDEVTQKHINNYTIKSTLYPNYYE